MIDNTEVSAKLSSEKIKNHPKEVVFYFQFNLILNGISF